MNSNPSVTFCNMIFTKHFKSLCTQNFKNLFNYLKESEIERRNERKRKNIHSWVHSLYGHNGQDWARLKSGYPQASSRLSTLVAEVQVHEVSLAAFPRPLAGQSGSEVEHPTGMLITAFYGILLSQEVALLAMPQWSTKTAT